MKIACPCGYEGPAVCNDRPNGDRGGSPASPYCPKCLRRVDRRAEREQ
jgi:hypothetical protein